MGCILIKTSCILFLILNWFSMGFPKIYSVLHLNSLVELYKLYFFLLEYPVVSGIVG